MSEPRTLSSGQLVRLVAAREVSTRVRDKTFLISSAVIMLLVLGSLVFQVAIQATANDVTVGVVGNSAAIEPALVAQGKALAVDVKVVDLPDVSAARAALQKGNVDGVLFEPTGPQPRLQVQRSAGGPLESVVQGAVSQLAVGRQLSSAGITRLDVPQVKVESVQPQTKDADQRTGAAVIGVVVLYALLILIGQFVAQGVVEEKSTRVVELLLATMRPWQLLAGKVLGLGLLGLAQIVLIAVVGLAGAIGFGVVAVPGQIIGTVAGVVGWFILGYAFYASVFAAAASLVSRQEDVGMVVMPTSILLVAGFVISLQAARNPSGTLATVTSFVPGLSPMVMPIRQAAGGAAWWEVLVSALIMLAAIAVVVRVGGRVYAGALLRTSGKTKIREALRAETA
jgi:ABC-2 type transport system permease protein